MTPFERVVGDSSKDHTVTAPTFTTRPTTEQLHHYAGRHWSITTLAEHPYSSDVVEGIETRLQHPPFEVPVRTLMASRRRLVETIHERLVAHVGARHDDRDVDVVFVTSETDRDRIGVRA